MSLTQHQLQKSHIEKPNLDKNLNKSALISAKQGENPYHAIDILMTHNTLKPDLTNTLADHGICSDIQYTGEVSFGQDNEGHFAYCERMLDIIITYISVKPGVGKSGFYFLWHVSWEGKQREYTGAATNRNQNSKSKKKIRSAKS